MKYPLFKVFMSDNVSDYVLPVLNSGMITQGPQVELFESELKEYFNYPYILTLNSATSGLTLAVRLLNLTSEDEVISTALTCTATNWPLLGCGAQIKWADVDENSCNISIESIKKQITSKTRAIMIVHWGGYPVDLDALQKVIDESGYDIPIIQDCAHAFGAKYNGLYLGTSAPKSIAVYSLQAIKHLTTGDGGLIFLPNKEMYDRAKLLRWFGIDREKKDAPKNKDFRMEADISEWGYKFHMNDINASIGRANIKHVSENIKKLQNNTKYYREQLKDVKHISLLEQNDKCESSCWLFTIKVSNKSNFIDFMNQKEIMVSQVHNRNDNHTCISKFKCDLPALDRLEQEMACIPAGWWMNTEDMNFIINSVKEWSVSQDFREIQEKDYNRGYLELLSQLNGYDYKKCFLNQEDFKTKLDLMRSQNSKIYVKELDGNIIATCKVLIEEKFGAPIFHIEDVCVDKNYRKNGIGKALINYSILQNKYLNPYKIILNCSTDLKFFYEKINFIESGIQMRNNL